MIIGMYQTDIHYNQDLDRKVLLLSEEATGVYRTYKFQDYIKSKSYINFDEFKNYVSRTKVLSHFKLEFIYE